MSLIYTLRNFNYEKFNRAQINSLLTKSDAYLARRGLAARNDPATNQRALYLGRRKVIPSEDTITVLQNIYNNPTTRVLGRDRFYNTVKSTHAGISRRDVSRFLKSQEVSQIHVQPTRKKVVKKPIVTSRVGALVQADLMDVSNIARHNNGFKFILLVMDHFSKRLWAFGMRRGRKDSEAVAHHLDETVIRELNLNHTPMRVLHTDNGGEFRGAVDELLNTLNIRHARSMPYCPQAHGMIERAVRTVRRYLQVQFDLTHRKRWLGSAAQPSGGILGQVVTAYNNSPHTVTRIAPLTLFAANPQSPLYQLARRRMEIQAAKMITDPAADAQRTPAVGNIVRISLVFADTSVRRLVNPCIKRKGSLHQWTRRLYRVKAINNKGIYTVRKLMWPPNRGEAPEQNLPVVVQVPSAALLLVVPTNTVNIPTRRVRPRRPVQPIAQHLPQRNRPSHRYSRDYVTNRPSTANVPNPNRPPSGPSTIAQRLPQRHKPSLKFTEDYVTPPIPGRSEPVAPTGTPSTTVPRVVLKPPSSQPHSVSTKTPSAPRPTSSATGAQQSVHSQPPTPPTPKKVAQPAQKQAVSSAPHSKRVIKPVTLSDGTPYIAPGARSNQ